MKLSMLSLLAALWLFPATAQSASDSEKPGDEKHPLCGSPPPISLSAEDESRDWKRIPFLIAGQTYSVKRRPGDSMWFDVYKADKPKKTTKRRDRTFYSETGPVFVIDTVEVEDASPHIFRLAENESCNLDAGELVRVVAVLDDDSAALVMAVDVRAGASCSYGDEHVIIPAERLSPAC